MSTEPKLKVDGVEYPFVLPDEMTMGERREAERITGQEYDWEGKFTPTGLLAIAYITVKRVNPQVRLDDLEALKGDAFEFIQEEEAKQVPPTSADAAPVSVGSSTETS